MPARLRRQRSQLVDAMLDGHFHFGNVRVALAAEPDLLWSAGSFLAELGAELPVCVTTTRSPLLERMPSAEVLIGDLEDFEQSALVTGCDLLMTHSHGRQAAERLGKPLFRIGMPIFDRIGNSHICHAGYRGTRNFVYEVGNLLMAGQPRPRTGRLAPAGRQHAPLPRCICPPLSRACMALTPELPITGVPMKVAFATQDQQRVDAHFGWAKHLAVYEVSPSGYAFLQDFPFGEDLAEDGNEDKLSPKLAAIHDCAIVYVAAIGGSAAARVVASKIHPVKVNQPEPILDILDKLQETLAGTPPPWLRKALLKGQERVHDFEEDDEVKEMSDTAEAMRPRMWLRST